MAIGDGVAKMLTARAGYDVRTANDRELSFNSTWPLLPIEAEGTFEVKNTLTAPVTIYNHALGYPPVFDVYYENSNEAYPTPDSNALGTICTVDNNNLYWRDVYFSATPMNLHWKIYRRSITINEDQEAYDLTAATAKLGIDGKIIVARPDKDVNSTDYRDIGFHSSWKQLIIDSSKYGTADTSDPAYYVITIDHNLGYKPMYKSFYLNSNGEWQQLGGLDVYSATITTTSASYKISVGTWGGSTPTLALLLFKSTINNDV